MPAASLGVTGGETKGTWGDWVMEEFPGLNPEAMGSCERILSWQLEDGE